MTQEQRHFFTKYKIFHRPSCWIPATYTMPCDGDGHRPFPTGKQGDKVAVLLFRCKNRDATVLTAEGALVTVPWSSIESERGDYR